MGKCGEWGIGVLATKDRRYRSYHTSLLSLLSFVAKTKRARVSLSALYHVSADMVVGSKCFSATKSRRYRSYHTSPISPVLCG